ncbi:TetR/AcrR family transcriptional repressor of mexJK operon [Streptacidiphilus sp. BW17]|uniref:TetR/AcrR family transcriptional regulator n=1 Tax=Streptacidiphilus sp. BW17 TaxID=3156274 RepID=UPI00351444DF
MPAGDRAERKRAAIVRAAADVFVREGYGAGVDRIAAEAGVSKVTVYNHFRSKETLFVEAVTGALDDALSAAVAGAEARLAASADLREALVLASREWVVGVTAPNVVGLRRLVADEVRTFPELGAAWRRSGPDRAHPALAAAFRRLADEGRLEMPDPGLAVTQLLALVLYPHLVQGACGDEISATTTENLIRSGVEMFLAYYRYREPGAGTRPTPGPG